MTSTKSKWHLGVWTFSDVTCGGSVWHSLRNLFLGIAHYWISAQDAYVLTLIGLTQLDFLS